MRFRYPLLGLAVLLTALAAGELFARFVLGLGNPPLSQTHPRIEYLFRPNQDVQRFGNRVLINAYGMRSPDFPPHKPAGEFRVLTFGDSVLNGGNLTDHTRLATTLLAERLAKAKGIPVVVGHISAGSWGPGNWLAYAREYGFFEADVVVLLISSHDAGDNPTFAPLNPNTHPQTRPMSALLEGFTRYLPKYLPAWAKPDTADPTAPPPGANQTHATEQGLADLSAFLDFAHAQVPRVLVIQYPEQAELGPDGVNPGHDLIGPLARQHGAEVFSAFPAMRAAHDQGEYPYRDNIHPNDAGQAVLASVFFEALTGTPP